MDILYQIKIYGKTSKLQNKAPLPKPEKSGKLYRIKASALVKYQWPMVRAGRL